MAYRHLKKFKIDPILYMTEWFMCIFSRTLPWSCVLRVWDMFFCEGQSYTLENKEPCFYCIELIQILFVLPFNMTSNLNLFNFLI